MHNDTCDSAEASTSGRFPMIVQNGMSVNFPVVGQISAAPPSENRGFVSTVRIRNICIDFKIVV